MKTAAYLKFGPTNKEIDSVLTLQHVIVWMNLAKKINEQLKIYDSIHVMCTYVIILQFQMVSKLRTSCSDDELGNVSLLFNCESEVEGCNDIMVS